MRWIVLGMALLTVLIVVLAIVIGRAGRERKHAPRERIQQPSGLVVYGRA